MLVPECPNRSVNRKSVRYVRCTSMNGCVWRFCNTALKSFCSVKIVIYWIHHTDFVLWMNKKAVFVHFEMFFQLSVNANPYFCSCNPLHVWMRIYVIFILTRWINVCGFRLPLPDTSQCHILETNPHPEAPGFHPPLPDNSQWHLLETKCVGRAEAGSSERVPGSNVNFWFNWDRTLNRLTTTILANECKYDP